MGLTHEQLLNRFVRNRDNDEGHGMGFSTDGTQSCIQNVRFYTPAKAALFMAVALYGEASATKLALYEEIAKTKLAQTPEDRICRMIIRVEDKPVFVYFPPRRELRYLVPPGAQHG